MKNIAAYLTKQETIEFAEVPVPKAKPDEILLKLEAVGVCGSDVHYYAHGRINDFVVKYPFILGHECAGTIVEVGSEVKELKVGDRVALEPGVPCCKCEMCLSGKYNLCPDVKFFATPPYDGCLMNYVAFPANFAFKLPDNVSTVEGALVEPLAIGVNAALTGGVKLGDTVVIFGAGCIGLVSLLAAKAYGAVKVIVADMLDKRLEVAKKLGGVPLNTKNCDVVKEIEHLTNGRGANVVIDCAGFSETVRSSIDVCGAAGTIVLVGLGAEKLDGIQPGPMSTKELTIKSIFRYRNLYPTTIAAIADGKIDISGIISDKYSFEDTPRAFADTLKNAKDIVKSVIVFND